MAYLCSSFKNARVDYYVFLNFPSQDLKPNKNPRTIQNWGYSYRCLFGIHILYVGRWLVSCVCRCHAFHICKGYQCSRVYFSYFLKYVVSIAI